MHQYHSREPDIFNKMDLYVATGLEKGTQS